MTSGEMSTLPFPKEGIRVSFFDVFIQENGGSDAFKSLSTTDVCERIVKPLTKEKGCSYLEFRKENYPEEDYVGTATVFISHAWKFQFLEVVGALQTHFADHMETIVWFDLFSNNQHAATQLPFEWWCGTFKSAIQQFGHTVMIFTPWNDPVPLTRAWCLFELYCTAETQSRFEIALSPEELKRFKNEILTETFTVINRMLGTIDVQRSECWKPEDRVRIFEAVEKTVGFDRLNSMAFEQLRSWIVESVKKQVEHEMARENADIHDQIRWELTLGVLFEEEGSLEAAKECFSDCLSLANNASLPIPEMFNLYNHLACVYCAEGRFSEAEEIFRACLLLDPSSSSSPSSKAPPNSSLICPSDLIDVKNNLGNALYAQQKYEEAEGYYLECLRYFRQLFSELYETEQKEQEEQEDKASSSITPITHSSQPKSAEDAQIAILEILNNLASLYFSQGLYAEAEPYYLECFEQQLPLLGAQHPHTCNALYNLGLLYQAKREPLTSRRYVEPCLATQRVILGDQHPDTLATLQLFAEILIELEDYGLAEKCLEEAYQSRLLVYGPKHSLLERCWQSLLYTRHKQGKAANSGTIQSPLHLQSDHFQVEIEPTPKDARPVKCSCCCLIM